MDFRTPRLRVENWTPHLEDEVRRLSLVRNLAAILTPDVLRHLPEPLQLAETVSVSDWMDDRASESAVFLVRETGQDTVIGLLLLAQPDPSSIETHIGYLFSETAWGQGFATELIRGLTTAIPRPARLLAGVDDGNPASARVLEKTGFARAPGSTLFSLSLD